MALAARNSRKRNALPSIDTCTPPRVKRNTHTRVSTYVVMNPRIFSSCTEYHRVGLGKTSTYVTNYIFLSCRVWLGLLATWRTMINRSVGQPACAFRSHFCMTGRYRWDFPDRLHVEQNAEKKKKEQKIAVETLHIISLQTVGIDSCTEKQSYVYTYEGGAETGEGRRLRHVESRTHIFTIPINKACSQGAC